MNLKKYIFDKLTYLKNKYNIYFFINKKIKQLAKIDLIQHKKITDISHAKIVFDQIGKGRTRRVI